jgi:hypothetical protein
MINSIPIAGAGMLVQSGMRSPYQIKTAEYCLRALTFTNEPDVSVPERFLLAMPIKDPEVARNRRILAREVQQRRSSFDLPDMIR